MCLYQEMNWTGMDNGLLLPHLCLSEPPPAMVAAVQVSTQTRGNSALDFAPREVFPLLLPGRKVEQMEEMCLQISAQATIFEQFFIFGVNELGNANPMQVIL